MLDPDDRKTKPRPRWLLPALFAASLVVLFSWLDRSETQTLELGTPSRIIVISDAGPIRVTQGPISEVTHSDSWLLGKPVFEIEADESDILVRVTCPSRTPCRSSIDLQVTGTPELLIMADGFVDVEHFSGKLTIVSASEDVALGPITGSVRVVANKTVTGSGLETDLLDISSHGDIDLWFGSNEAYRVQILGPSGGERTGADSDIEIDIKTDGEAERSVALRTPGKVRLMSGSESPSGP